jgi:hypothetical protein
VEIVTRNPMVGHVAADTHDLGATYARLRRGGVRFTPNTEVTRIDGAAATPRDVYTGEVSERSGVAGVVLALGGVGETALAKELAATDLDVRLVGDCLAPRRVFNAIWEGNLAGLELA